MSSFSGLSLFGLASAAAAAVVTAGAIALISDQARRRLQRRMDLMETGPAKLQEIDRLNEELESKRRELAELEKHSAEAKQLREDTGRLRGEIQSLEQERDALQAEANKTAETRAKREEIERDLEQARNYLASTEAERRALEQSAVAAQGRANAAEEELQHLQNRLDQVRSALEPEEDELRDARASLRQTRREIEDAQPVLQRYNEARESEAETARLESALRSAQEELEKAKADLGDAQRRRDEADEQCTRFLQRTEALREELSNHEGGFGRDMSEEKLNERLDDIWTPIVTPVSERTVVHEEVKCLQNVQKHLQDSGLVFHQRTVYALHTALKCAMEAPLLVLAGISGTGKTLLPKKYAEAMGINFQLISVQPRWDGPQDLLGFYNHLENKYIAHDLTRSLAQMDLYREDWEAAGWTTDQEVHGSLSDQLLLVLLDEMNLARVEYYFSEFLSRLEIRRTIDESDSEARRQVSIALDAGPLPEGIQAPRLYPGRNTLFVGTMNEDESTQSLSDKVVDRANIMRFARPSDRLPPTPASGPKPQSARLSFSVWENWKRENNLSDTDRTHVDSTVNKLNDALDLVERPFGHRLTEAVRTYVRMYPTRAQDRVNLALCDQIELRILPKLRGIELDSEGEDAVNIVAEIAGELGDRDLREAIDNGNDRERGRFHWTGLSRNIE